MRHLFQACGQDIAAQGHLQFVVPQSAHGIRETCHQFGSFTQGGNGLLQCRKRGFSGRDLCCSLPRHPCREGLCPRLCLGNLGIPCQHFDACLRGRGDVRVDFLLGGNDLCSGQPVRIDVNRACMVLQVLLQGGCRCRGEQCLLHGCRVCKDGVGERLRLCGGGVFRSRQRRCALPRGMQQQFAEGLCVMQGGAPCGQ